MSHPSSLPTYNAIAAVLTDLNIVISVSEAHGLLCGLLAGGETAPLEPWLELLHNDESIDIKSLPDSAKETLEDLIEDSDAALQDETNQLRLLLPAEDAEFSERARSLGEWCQGFVAGLGISGCYINQKSNQEAAEVLQDLVDIGKISVFDGGSDEELQAFKEVLEYVQVAVLLLYRSLQFADDTAHLLSDTLH